jgi:hypothetical protein
VELDLRGIEADTIREYLAGLGAVRDGADLMTGAGWQVTLEVGVHRFSHWDLPRVILRFSGEPAVVEGVVRRLRLLTMRGGG